jgi:hypothetical protein
VQAVTKNVAIRSVTIFFDTFFTSFYFLLAR